MTASVRVRRWPPTTRHPKGVTTYQVVYRRGGRSFKLETAGSFATRKEARARRDLVAGWLAAGLNPRDELARLLAAPTRSRSYRDVAAAYTRSRIDIARETRKNLDSHTRRLDELFGAAPVSEITVGLCIEAVAALAAGLKPASVHRYWATHRLILDFAGLDPNPARDKAVRLPAVVAEEASPPTAEEFVRMLEAMPRRYWLPLVVIEQTAMRVGEAAALMWGDVDESGLRFRLRGTTTKTRRARWVQVPGWLMVEVAASCPPDDRLPERRVFVGFTADVAKNAMARACRTAGLPVYSPHDLRHRRMSLWHGQGVPAKQLAERAGHARASLSLDTYSHVMPLDEVSQTTYRGLLVMSR